MISHKTVTQSPCNWVKTSSVEIAAVNQQQVANHISAWKNSFICRLSRSEKTFN